MTEVERTLLDFGRQMGVDGLELAAGGVAQISFPDGSALSIDTGQTDRDNPILLHLSRPVGHDAARAIPAALRLAHCTNAAPFPVQVAASGQGGGAQLIVLVRLAEHTFTPQLLDQAIRFLKEWQEKVRANIA